MLHAIIMAGGSGTRFWPTSRNASPKQLLDLAGGRTMIQATVDRLGELASPERTLVVTNRRLVDAISQQLPDLPPESLIGEPCKRDTAPCIGLAAALVSRNDPDAVMVVMPADHVIRPTEQFQRAIQHAVKMVDQEPSRIVTFGISPSYAAESFGYIERGEDVEVTSDAPATYRVVRFREKPSAATAKEYLSAGNFYWNSGIFVWKAATILEALRKYEPEMMSHLNTIADAAGTANFEEVLDREFSAIKGKSIDYAVMEHYEDVVVVEAPFQWDDVGSWQSLARLRDSDENGNTIIGKYLGISTQNTIVRSAEDHLIVTIGLDDCIVVHTPDATLVARKDQEEAVREVVKQLEERGWQEYL
jgi:mannose-1-phosphate guanylyltransferase